MSHSSLIEGALRDATLVEASAGTGKTEEITHLFVRGLIENHLRADQILVVTYTKAAAAELRSRIRRRITDAIEARKADDPTRRTLAAALFQMDQAAISTIHGFCQRLLLDYPLLLRADSELTLTDDASWLAQEIASDFWARELHDLSDPLLRAMQTRGITAEHLASLAKLAWHPFWEILGPDPSTVPSDALIGPRVNAFRDGRALWQEHRDVVIEILLRDPSLNRNKYQPRTITNRWLPDLEAFFEDDPLALPKDFHRLRQSTIDQAAKKKFTPPQHAFFVACDRLHDADDALQTAMNHDLFLLQKSFIEFAKDALAERKRKNAMFSYDDLLLSVFEGLTSPGGNTLAHKIRTQYPMALIDEFQDTDPVQYEILKSIYGTGQPVVYVGDPKQAIYRFRGADVFSYFAASRDVGGRRHTLDTNWRSDAPMVHAVNTLFSQTDDPFLFSEIPFRPVKAAAARTTLDEGTAGASATTTDPANRMGAAPASSEPPMELLFIDPTTTPSPANLAANEIAALLASGAPLTGRPVAPRDIAVLCRTNTQANEVAEALQAQRIPVALDGDKSIVDTDVCLQVLQILEAAAAPADRYATRRALLTTLLGWTPRELAGMSDDDAAEWAERFQAWHDVWRDRGVARLLEEVLDTSKGELRLASHALGRRYLADLTQLQELLMDEEHERRLPPLGLLQWLRRQRAGASDVLAEELQQRSEAGTNAVRVTTIHKSKGLQYGVVLIPFATQGVGLSKLDKAIVRFHDPSDDYKPKIDLGSRDIERHLKLAAREETSEAVRLLYVAVTRARHRCILIWGARGKWAKSALGHVLFGGREKGWKRWSADELHAALREVARESQDTIRVRAPRLEPPPPRVNELDRPPAPTARPATRTFDPSPNISSFTQLAGGAMSERLEPPELAAAAGTDAGIFPNLRAGATTGLLLHRLLEQVDLAALDAPEARSRVEAELRSSGYRVAWADETLDGLRRVAETPLWEAGNAPCLALIEQHAREVEFTLATRPGSLHALAQVLKKHNAPDVAPSYWQRLAGLRDEALRRYLRGFVDLLFEWNGRWYFVDYKSNQLASYDTECMAEAMTEAHYFLQGQLYAAAMHRHLRARLPDYRPDKHWGGGFFLFLRGMQGGEHPASGVLRQEQSPQLLFDVDQWLGESHADR